jgi:hypothetical protein
VGRVAVDSSKVQANASKRRAISFGRVWAKECQLRDEVKRLLALAQATAADDAEDAQDGGERPGDDLPAEIRRRQNRLQPIDAAKPALDPRAKADALAANNQSESAKPYPTAQ